jgi:competence protein ComEC
VFLLCLFAFLAAILSFVCSHPYPIMFQRALAYAPLAPVAIAATIGIVADRFLTLPFEAALLVIIAGLTCWISLIRQRAAIAPLGLWIVAGGVAMAYHHDRRHHFPADDIGEYAGIEPKLVVVRGILEEEPVTRHYPANDPLVNRPRPETTSTIVSISEIQSSGLWQTASGKVRLHADSRLEGLRVGDECEVTGWLTKPLAPMNPGERDHASRLLDERIRAELRVRQASDNIVRLRAGGWSIDRMLGSIRAWSQRGLEERLRGEDRQVAAALLLGDSSALTTDEWERYIRTGVIHVLAISGQHLVILGAFLWFVLRLLGVPRRSAALTVASVLVGYALLTGGRPSAMRAAVMACTICFGILLRRRALPANSFALAWLVVLLINPTDLFTAGFQLSFLCVAVLIWGIPKWFPPRELTPLEQLIDESRPAPLRWLRHLFWLVRQMYLITLVLAIATAPLIIYWQNLVSPAGLLIGPMAIMLTTVGLVCGFIVLLTWPLGVVSMPFAWLTSLSLSWCETIVRWAEQLPVGWWYVSRSPLWWLIGFYVIGIGWMVALEYARMAKSSYLHERRWWFPGALSGWIVLGLALGEWHSDSDEFRMTFVAVDHGACVVMETPDGRVFLYDVGATSGPDVTKRSIAPFLWHRGIRHIDEVFLSHADLDHFNGLPQLMERFSIGQITYTPSFAEKSTPGVRKVVEVIATRGIKVRQAQRGDRFRAGPVEMHVLHPPPTGPSGEENARSLVLLVKHQGHSILLTGDLEQDGMTEVLAQPSTNVDVLMTPHHGSVGRKVADIESLATWAKPKLVVSCQGRGDEAKAEAVYRRQHIPYWGTWPQGAITIRSHRTGLIAETFVGGERTVVRSGSEK